MRSKIGEKWERKVFEIKTDAETYAQRKQIELLNQGREGVEFPSWLAAILFFRLEQRQHFIHRPTPLDSLSDGYWPWTGCIRFQS